MELILQKKKADAFVKAMDDLSDKFNGIYIKGKLEDCVKLDIIDDKMELTFIQPVPEMVKIVCYLVFVNNLI